MDSAIAGVEAASSVTGSPDCGGKTSNFSSIFVNDINDLLYVVENFYELLLIDALDYSHDSFAHRYLSCAFPHYNAITFLATVLPPLVSQLRVLHIAFEYRDPLPAHPFVTSVASSAPLGL